MAAKSRFTRRKEIISKPKQHFEHWLRRQGYESCTEMYPAATLASALVDEYLQEYPEREDSRDIIEAHAEEIGLISDYSIDGADDE